MTTDDAKVYLSKREIPRLFESLMTGLMYHRPDDHLRYLIDCLSKVQDKGQENITWSSFVDIRRTKTPLPPINGHRRHSSKGSRPSSHTRGVTPKGFLRKKSKLAFEDEKPSSPLPAISSSISSSSKLSLPDLPIVLVMGAPGSGKHVQVDKLLQRYPDWAHLNMGDLIRQEVATHGDAHAKWRMTKDLLNRGEAAPEDVTAEVLIKALMGCSNVKGVIVNGFPRSLTQVADYDKLVGRVDCVFMLDCDEQIATDRLLRRGKESSQPEDSLGAVAARLNYFKSNTLRAAKEYDDRSKLVVIDGDAGEDVVEQDFGKAFDSLFFSKYGSRPLDTSRPLKSRESAPAPATYRGKWEKEDSALTKEYPLFPGAIPPPPIISETDTGRKEDVPQCPIIFVAGGPGSGKGTQCQKIVDRYSGFQHISMGDIIRDEISTKGTADDKWSMISQLVSKGEMAPQDVTIDLLKDSLKKHMSAKAFVIEGFPRDQDQIEGFNKHIGGLSFVMLFDCDEYYMQTRLMKRGKDSGRIDDNLTAIANRINFYKHHTLPVLKHYDDIGKLVVMDADGDSDEMFFGISKLFDFALFGKKDDGVTDDEQEMAAVKIQANFRGFMVRSGKSSSSKQEKLSTDDEKLMAKEAKIRALTGSGTTEDSNNSDIGDTKAAQAIQASFHGYNKRREVKIKKVEKKAKETIQAGFKGFKNRKELLQTQQKEVASEKNRTLYTKENRAALQIQAGFKGYKSRTEAKAKKLAKEDSAALKIQAGFKGFKCRKDAKDKKLAKKDKAALNIQAGFKGFKSRTETKAKKAAKEAKKEAITEEEAQSRIQAGFLGFKTRESFRAPEGEGKQTEDTITGDTADQEDDDDDGKDKTDKDLDQAANRIQASYHGYKTRQKYHPSKVGKDDTCKTDKDLDQAADRIQASYHGYKTRQKYHPSKVGKDKTDKDLETDNNLDAAAKRIQASYRGYKTRQKYHSSKAPKKESQVPVQEEVIEATITVEGATTTGDNIANPSHTALLDQLAKDNETA